MTTNAKYPLTENQDSPLNGPPANVTAAVHAHPWLTYRQLSRRVDGIRNQNASGVVKRTKFIQLAEEVNEAIRPFSACKQGCSHCCYRGSVVFRHEAERLAQVTGRKMAEVAFRSEQQMQRDSAKYFNTPCPFLLDDACSVYEHRPMSCRLVHALNESGDACALGEGKRPTLHTLELFPLWNAYGSMAERINNETVGTLHEYFPAI
jgi:Fe-S-cluster containining protein